MLQELVDVMLARADEYDKLGSKTVAFELRFFAQELKNRLRELAA